MIKIDCDGNSITIRDHAGYDCMGRDIVCSAVSVLVQTFLATMGELHYNGVKTVKTDEKGAIRRIQLNRDLTKNEKLLLKSFFIGINGIAMAYPENVKILCSEEHIEALTM